MLMFIKAHNLYRLFCLTWYFSVPQQRGALHCLINSALPKG